MRIACLLVLLAVAEARDFRNARQSDFNTRCWSSATNTPARWWNEGERIDRGRFWYECQNGQLAPMGCFTEENNRINVGETCHDNGYVARCEIGQEGHLELAYTGCLSPDGREHPSGSEWVDEKNEYYYACKPHGRYLRNVVDGCVEPNSGAKVTIGERVEKGDYVYECRQRFNGSVHMCSVGCVHEGTHHNVGSQWTAGEFVYYCQSRNGECTKTVIGCNYENKKLYDGDRYRKGDVVYQCEIRDETFGARPVGCVRTELDGTKIDRVVGCRWYIQGDDFKIEQTCVVDGEVTKVETVGCIYRYKGFDTIFLHPDTYTIWRLPKVLGESVGLACRSEGNSARLTVFEPDNVSQAAHNLIYNEPNTEPDSHFKA